jgi:hypothetical protein
MWLVQDAIIKAQIYVIVVLLVIMLPLKWIRAIVMFLLLIMGLQVQPGIQVTQVLQEMLQILVLQALEAQQVIQVIQVLKVLLQILVLQVIQVLWVIQVLLVIQDILDLPVK